MSKSATLYRMVMDDHLCPFGLKSKYILEQEGFAVDDNPLTSREETEAFKKKHGVGTTPQTFIDGERIGGHEALRKHFGHATEGQTSYRPVVVIFATALAMAVAAGWVAFETVVNIRLLEWFIAFSMCFLAVQKLKDVEGFSTMFLNYDLLARRWVPYGYFYPYAEGAAGVLMIAGVLIWIAAPVALFIGTVGAVSVFKAVYVDKRELTCACVGGNSNVPLGFVSLTENLMMMAMGIWMLARSFPGA